MMCSNRNHCYNYKTVQHYKWRDKFRILCICNEFNFLKTQKFSCTAESLKGSLRMPKKQKTTNLPKCLTKRSVGKESNEMAEELLGFAKSKPEHLMRHMKHNS